MRIFGQAFLGAFAGRVVVTLLVAWLVVLGFGPDYWVRAMTAWFAEPLSLTLAIVRIAALLLAGGGAVFLLWPKLKQTATGKKLGVKFLDTSAEPTALFDSSTRRRLLNRAIYIHVVASAEGRQSLDACSGRLSQIERLDAADKVIASLQGTRELVWAPRELGRTTVPLHPGSPHELDIFRTVESSSKLELLCIGHPQLWADFFDAPGKYRLRINVAADGMSKMIALRLVWRGKWNDFDISAEP